MIRLSKSVLAVGGVVLAAGLIGVTNPKTVHALAAALVQVTNTASNPVVTESTDHQAGQLVNLQCDGVSGRNCFPISSTTGNTQGGSFQVPAGKSFVVTAVDITTLSTDPQCGGSRNFWLDSTNDSGMTTNLTRWWIGPNGNYHFTYPTGFVIGSGSSVSVDDDNACYSQSLAYDDFVMVQGYLTVN